MNKDHGIGLAIIFLIIAIGLFGGVKNRPRVSSLTAQQQIEQAQTQAKNIQTQIDEANASPFKGEATLSYINRSTDPAQEYIVIKTTSFGGQNINVTGWTIKSLASGATYKIPQGTYLYWTNSQNSDTDIILAPGDTMYVNSGVSPNSENFKLNKCSGYLNQSENFVPYISTYCPSPRNEDLSSIPRDPTQNACFDFIDAMPSCRAQTSPLPAGLSAQCSDFIYKKINYSACVDAHKNDSDFYQPEWRVYLKHTQTLWLPERETIALYDRDGKLVDTLKY